MRTALGFDHFLSNLDVFWNSGKISLCSESQFINYFVFYMGLDTLEMEDVVALIQSDFVCIWIDENILILIIIVTVALSWFLHFLNLGDFVKLLLAKSTFQLTEQDTSRVYKIGLFPGREFLLNYTLFGIFENHVFTLDFVEYIVDHVLYFSEENIPIMFHKMAQKVIEINKLKGILDSI